MVERQYDMMFDTASSGRPWMIFPKVFSDNRGSFSEVLVGSCLDGIKQVNRSTSCQWAIRGCHAQRAPHCQAKLVEALNLPIYDIITDARPDSKTFGLTEVYYLNPQQQNKLYVPCGFLHAFAVPPSSDRPHDNAMFMYYCNETYCKSSEVGINPMSLVPQVAKAMSNAVKDDSILYAFVKMLETPEKIVLSQKDTNGLDYAKFMEDTLSQYNNSKFVWYKN